MGYSFWKTFWLDQLKSSYPLTQWPNFCQVVLKKISNYEKKNACSQIIYNNENEKQIPPSAITRLVNFKCFLTICCCSVAKLYPTLRPHGLQHTRLPCSSLSPGVCSNSCLLIQWCHLTISFSATHVFSCPQFFPQWVGSPHQVAMLHFWPWPIVKKLHFT